MGLLDDWLAWRQGNAGLLGDATQAGADATMKALRGGLLSDAEREALVNTPAAWLGTEPLSGGKAAAARRVFDGSQRTIRDGDRVGVARVSQWGSSPNANIDAVYAATPGGGRAAMEDILRQADEAGISLGLDAVPMSNPYTYAEPMTPEQLRAWYERFGFEHSGGNRMLRSPKAR
jgi:hypothetical protein